MSGDLLREAAALMRSRAEATAAPHHPYGDKRMALVTTTEEWSQEIDNYLGGDMGRHAASWHPAVALAVADWLDAFAALYEASRHRERPVFDDYERALAVARAYLGRDA